MYCHTHSKSLDQPGKVANPVRGQLNRIRHDKSSLKELQSVMTLSLFQVALLYVLV